MDAESLLQAHGSHTRSSKLNWGHAGQVPAGVFEKWQLGLEGSMGTDRVELRFSGALEEDEEKEDLQDLDYRYRKDEIFKRLKVTTFAQLVTALLQQENLSDHCTRIFDFLTYFSHQILQVASVSDLNESDDGESHAPEDGLSVVSDADLECLSEHTNGFPQASPLSDRQDAGDIREICYSARSTLLSVISGVGELNLDRINQKTENESVASPEPADRPYPDCPYLLLDVRDCDQFDRCHIISAHSFPIAMLSRTMNPYTKEVLNYKNAAGKIIIVYDEDERIASQAATTMCERGFENLFMLSGGLKVIAQKFPEGLTTGSIPTSCLPSPTKGKRRSAAQQPSQAAEKRWRFTSDELSKIQEQLEEMLIPSNANSKITMPQNSQFCFEHYFSIVSLFLPRLITL
ncbi:hypothetical protein L3Q82_023641 [Scortum barcoo]|uniref:Uncharacterized protein n=1 Tax=Scortum barcoo TaxID=214431 RepID=A0ACB8WT38_9TELE|nr:hypothetical protein L3Q82_023641 [Scortum barcoo]